METKQIIPRAKGSVVSRDHWHPETKSGTSRLQAITLTSHTDGRYLDKLFSLTTVEISRTSAGINTEKDVSREREFALPTLDLVEVAFSILEHAEIINFLADESGLGEVVGRLDEIRDRLDGVASETIYQEFTDGETTEEAF